METEQTTKRTTEPRLTIRVSTTTHRKLRMLAAQLDTSIQALLTPAIETVADRLK